ncbi:hypothetical protein [Actinoplanes utahensis]|uniref:Uncharacterized protein n=1 Tax=Actinoplanes utahensis TaxID=1869 RepID=A0A0A6UAT5_ACTUT|nr:hypothetical protein [Actinoplanes utahensis]KHD72173.1 hypothetical protein MB27_41765 [Actinoplanes utahensis]GIF27576.1 hypothetical protein Aut01nite_05620 [Actinoplanes utahensis]
MSGAIGSVIGYQVYTHRFFTVSTADGKRYPAEKASVEAEALGGLESYGVYIDVPESFRAGTLRVDPVAGLRQADGDPITWIVTPKGGGFPIKLAG